MADREKYSSGRSYRGSGAGSAMVYVAPKYKSRPAYIPTPKPPPITLPKISILEPREWEKDDG